MSIVRQRDQNYLTLDEASDIFATKNALSSKITNPAVTGNISDSAVTTNKLASDAVTTVKITDSNVTDAKLATAPDTLPTNSTLAKRTTAGALASAQCLVTRDSVPDGNSGADAHLRLLASSGVKEVYINYNTSLDRGEIQANHTNTVSKPLKLNPLGGAVTTLNNTLDSGGNASIAGTLGVTGTSTLGVTNTGALSSTTGTFSSTLGVTGTSTLGTTNTGALSSTTGTFSGAVSTGALSSTTGTFSGAVGISGALSVTGSTTLNTSTTINSTTYTSPGSISVAVSSAPTHTITGTGTNFDPSMVGGTLIAGGFSWEIFSWSSTTSMQCTGSTHSFSGSTYTIYYNGRVTCGRQVKGRKAIIDYNQFLDNGALIAENLFNSAKKVCIGYNNTTNTGFITAVEEGVSYRALILNPLAGAVQTKNSTLDDGSGVLTVGAAIMHKVTTVSGGTTQTLSNSAYMWNFTGATDMVATLPAASTNSGLKLLIVCNKAANTVTINRAGSDSIDGAATSYILNTQYSRIELISDGVSIWYTV